MLSNENSAKIVRTGLYSAEPEEYLMRYDDDPYWCKNWTFKVQQGKDGKYTWWTHIFPINI